jgi:hypothetical protein
MSPFCVELFLTFKIYEGEGVAVRANEHGNDLFSGPQTPVGEGTERMEF